MSKETETSSMKPREIQRWQAGMLRIRRTKGKEEKKKRSRACNVKM